MTRIVSIFTLLLALLGQLALHAQTDTKNVSVAWEGLQPRVSFSLVSMVDEHVKTQLSSGLKKRFVVSVFANDGGTVIASRLYACAITYDLWENTFIVGIGKHQAKTTSLSRATQLCLNTQGLRIGSPELFKKYQGQELSFTVHADFDPISKDQCQALVRPGSSTDLIAPVAINLVRREICAAGRTAEVKAEAIEVPTP